MERQSGTPSVNPGTGVDDRIRLVILDSDGVLVDSERIAARVDAALLAELGWPLSEAEIVERFMGRTHDHMIAAIERQLGDRLSPDWQTSFDRRYLEAFDAQLQLVPGVLDALERITIPTCVASSGSHAKLRRTLGHVGLLERFQGRIFSADDVARGKPSPDLFLHAAARMGVTPGACAVVEDSPSGLEAARAAGMRPLAYAGGLVALDRLAAPGTTVFDDMRRLPDLLASL